MGGTYGARTDRADARRGQGGRSMTSSATTAESSTTARPAISPAEFRTFFPSLRRVVHLANCSIAPPSYALDQAMATMLSAMGEPGSSWRIFEQQTEQARHRFAALIHADPDQIAVIPNATVGAYQVASTLRLGHRPG